MIIHLIRNIFTEKSTGGRLLVDGEPYCHTLEDVSRGHGVKIKHETCIPSGLYHVGKRFSPGFGRNMLSIYNVMEDAVPVINLGGVRFTYVMTHGGNTATNTSGCPLVAFNRLDDDTIQGSAESKLFEHVSDALDRGDDVTLHVIADQENMYHLL